jgi:hypothetical protein
MNLAYKVAAQMDTLRMTRKDAGSNRRHLTLALCLLLIDLGPAGAAWALAPIVDPSATAGSIEIGGAKLTVEADDPITGADSDWGPAMQGLTEKRRRFVLALNPEADYVDAAVTAGYRSASSSRQSMYSIASRLANESKVRAAMQEVGWPLIGRYALAAIKRVAKIAMDDKHPQNLRACKILIDRAWPVEARQQIEIHHHRKNSLEMEELCRRLADELGVSIERLLGTFSVSPVIDGQSAVCDARSQSKDGGTEGVADLDRQPLYSTNRVGQNPELLTFQTIGIMIRWTPLGLRGS